jgi:hypothetical protein
MHTSKKAPRRRCSSCRKWFRPAPSASATQRTCSEACRRVRQRRLARQRRERELHEYRVDERERQRASRERRRARTASTSASRASLPEEFLLLKEEVLSLWDEQARRSRATLARRLHRLLCRSHRP